MNFKEYYLNLSVTQKMQLYIIIIGIFYMIDYSLSIVNNQSEKQIIKQEKKVNRNYDSSDIIKKLEEIATLYNIYINSIVVEKMTIKLNIKGDFEGLVGFIKKTDDILLIKELSLWQEDKYILGELNISLEKYMLNKKKHLNYVISNPFENLEKKKEKIIQKEKVYKLSAIIGKEVCIDDNWYKKGDILENMKLIDILDEYIILENLDTSNKIKIELFKD